LVEGADEAGVVRGVKFIEERGEADAAGDAVHFGEGKAVVGDKEVRTQDNGGLVFNSTVASVGDEAVGLAAVQVTGNPGEGEVAVAEDFFALGGTVVEQFLGVVEGVTGVADLFDFGDLSGSEGESGWREFPGFFGEECLGV
jgi:hypothetical protein